MSLCRFSSDSDVYVYNSVYGGFSIHTRSSDSWETWSHPFANKQYHGLLSFEAIAILDNLKANGLKVPLHVFSRLRRINEKDSPF